jgi:succinate dehydrogenase/fumarate reductase flavoprotein subunit
LTLLQDPLNPTKVLGPEALRGSGGILVNQKGQRFVNELDLRSVVAAAILKVGLSYPSLSHQRMGGLWCPWIGCMTGL